MKNFLYILACLLLLPIMSQGQIQVPAKAVTVVSSNFTELDSSATNLQKSLESIDTGLSVINSNIVDLSNSTLSASSLITLSNNLNIASNYLNNSIALVQTNLNSTSNNLINVVGLETTNRINSDVALSNAIPSLLSLSNNLNSASNALNNYIGLVQTNLINTSNNFINAIGLEATNRINADAALSNNINNVSNTIPSLLSLSNDLYVISNSLNNAIGLVQTNLINTSNNLVNIIEIETTNRINSDTALSNSINNVSNAIPSLASLSNDLNTASNSLNLSIGLETTNRINANAAFTNQIEGLTNYVQAVTSVLNNAIGLETTNRIDADASLSNQINGLTNYIQIVTGTLNNAIGLEITNRINADAAFTNQIEGLTNYIQAVTSTLNNAVGLETTNRINADAALSNLTTEASTVLTNLILQLVESPTNFLTYSNSVDSKKGYLSFSITNGGGGGSASLLSTQIVNFAQNQSVTFSNAVAVAIYDNSVATSETVTTLFNLYNEACLDTEDIKHTNNFIVSTNGYRGNFTLTSIGTKVTDGSVMKIGNDWYPIYTITNGGTQTASVVITKWLQPNTTQTITRIQNIRINDFNTSLSVAGGTNSAFFVRNLARKGLVTGFYIGPDYMLMSVTPSKYSLSPSTSFLEGEILYISRDNGETWYPFGPLALRNTTTYGGIRINSSDGTNFFFNFGYAGNAGVQTTLRKSTNFFQTTDVITNSGNRYWGSVAASPGGQIIYACANSNAAGFGDFIYKSTDAGITWTPLTSALTRTWWSIWTSDGTNVVAGTYSVGGLGGALTGGVFFSSDGGTTWTNPPSQRTTTWGNGGRVVDIAGVSTSKIYFMVGAVAAAQGAGFWVTTNFGATFSRISTDFSGHNIDISPTNSQMVYTTPYVNAWGIFLSTNDFTNYINVDNPSGSGVDYSGADFRSICFSPVNPNIGYATSADGQSSSGIYGYLYKTVNGGNTWSIVGSLGVGYWHTVTTYDGNRVYVAASRYGNVGDFGPLYYSTDGGTNWTALDNIRKPWVTLVMPNSNTVYGASRIADTQAGVVGSGSGRSLLFEMNTSDHIPRLYGGKFNGAFPAYATYSLLSKGSNIYMGLHIAAGAGFGALFASTNYGESFDNPSSYMPTFNYLSSIAITDSKTNKITYWCGNSGTIQRGTNDFASGLLSTYTTVDGSQSRARNQIWTSRDGTRVLNALTRTPNIAFIISTNSGSTFTTGATNGINAAGGDFIGITSPDEGDTIIVSRNGGTPNTAGILTNMLANPNQSNLTFIASSRPMQFLTSISSNMVIGAGTGGYVGVSYDKGSSWTNITIGQNLNIHQIAIDDRDATTNSFWFLANLVGGSSVELYYTTNFFSSFYKWGQTNLKQQVLDRNVGAFTIAYKNTNIFVACNEAGAFVISTNAGETYTQPSYMSGLNLNWSGVASYDGDIIYAAPGMINNNFSNHPLYVIDRKNNTFSYIDDPSRTRAYTHVHTPNGINIYATSFHNILNTINYTEIPTNGFYSVITSCSSPSSQFWTDINDTLADYAEDSTLGTEIYFSFSFDNNSSFNIWKTNSWTCIITNESGTWKYYDGTNFVSAYSNTSVATLSDAMSYPSNRMSYIEITSIPDSGWEQAGGFKTNSTTTVYIGASMRSTNIYVTPSISSFTFDVNKQGDLTKLNMEDYELIYQPTNNTQTIIRKEQGVTDAEIFYINK